MKNSAIFDGPLQRQMLLMKLAHEMSNRPDFGTSYVSDPDYPVNRWISRVKALMFRASIGRSVEFDASVSTCVRFWTPSVHQMLRSVHDAIEEIKLELELFQDDEIGRVYDENSEFQFVRDLLDIVGSATIEVFVIDPYFDAAAFAMMFSERPLSSIRIAMTKRPEGVREVVQRYIAEVGASIEVRTSKDLHDRLLFIDGKDCWLIGASIKDGGRKPTYLMPLHPDLAQQKLAIYNVIWQRS